MDAYPQEVLADEEPKYLRRQRPLEIKRRKFGRRAWSAYLRVAVWTAAGFAGSAAAYEIGHFLLASPEMALVHPEQVVLSGNHHVSPANILEIFAADRSKSVLRIPLDRRRQQIEAIPWVERATVRRALPNKIEVEISERTPIAFLREPGDMALIDVHGVILDRPLEGDFHFPVVTGLTADMAPDDREKRMRVFSGFTQQIESARSGAIDQLSEVDLSDDGDVRATLAGLGGAPDGQLNDQPDAPVLVHFGNTDFEAKYQTLVQDIGLWRAKVGPVASVDLRFSREAIVNQDTAAVAQQRALNNVQERAVNNAQHSASKKAAAPPAKKSH